MAEIAFIFILTFLVPALFWLFHLPIQYLDETMMVLVVVIGIPFLMALPSAPFVPSNKERVKIMIQLAGLKKTDRVKELGCGDGRVIREAAKKGVAEAIGYEISFPLIMWGKFMGWLKNNSAQIVCKNIWGQDYSQTDVVFCYLLPQVMPRVEKEIWSQLPKGARLISHAFPMKNVKEDKKEGAVYLYVKK